MIAIDYPVAAFRTEKRSGIDYIFDTYRKRWLKLTPEEWVRQNFLQYMTAVLHYPSALIAVEKEILLGELTKRFDILVYDRLHQPWIIVECKAMSVPLTEDVLQQILRYSIPVPAPYLIITNGSYTTGWKKENGGLRLLEKLPEWEG